MVKVQQQIAEDLQILYSKGGYLVVEFDILVRSLTLGHRTKWFLLLADCCESFGQPNFLETLLTGSLWLVFQKSIAMMWPTMRLHFTKRPDTSGANAGYAWRFRVGESRQRRGSVLGRYFVTDRASRETSPHIYQANPPRD